jgi:hypothetical protein
MGCDIHAYVEHKNKNYDHWSALSDELSLGRYYGVFGRIAGVRCDGCLVEPKGIPEDLSWQAEGNYWLRVNDTYKDDDDYCSTEDAMRWIKNGCRVKLKADNTIDRVEHPDWHTPTWLTADELEACLVGIEDGAEYKAVLAAMKSLEASNRDVRLVLWFDN